MSEEIFGGNIELGGLKNPLEIKLLISYLLSLSKEEISEDILRKAILSEGLVNYFDLSEAIIQMKNSGQIIESEGLISLSSENKNDSGEFYRLVPLSVREKCGKAFLKILARAKNEKENSVEIISADSGFKVNMVIKDKDEDLLTLSLSVPDENTAVATKELFLDNAPSFYQKIIEFLSE
jgi:hypothetical protein